MLDQSTRTNLELEVVLWPLIADLERDYRINLSPFNLLKQVES